MINVLENKKSGLYEIHSQYDPRLIDIIKDVPGRYWNSDKKFWTIPIDRLGFFLSKIRGTMYENITTVYSYEDINVNQEIGTTASIPDIDISDVDLYVQDGCKLFNHQIDFLKYAIDRQNRGLRSGFLLADQPGAGKTLEVTNLALYNRKHRGAKHCLVVCCVNSAKYNWKEDIVKHTNGQEVPYILGARLRRDKITERYDEGSASKLKDLEVGHMYGKEEYPELPYFLIVNIEAFRYRVKKSYPFSDKIINWINRGLIDMVVLDEIHRNCSSSSTQGQQVLRVKKNSKMPVEWIPMTGTPITSQPTDVFLPLRLTDVHQSNAFSTWKNTFCIFGGFGDKEIIAYKNIPLLKQMLEPNMLRRLKKDILDLPPKIRHTEFVENTSYQSKLYKKLEEEMIEDKEEILSSMNPLVRFLKLRQVNGSPELIDDSISVDDNYASKNAKLGRLMELIDDIVANGEKVVVFSNWVEPLRTLYKFISKKYKTCCYTGTMAQDVRQKHKDAFINNPSYSVMLGTVGALGVSHTLTVARNIIFYDEPWNPSDIEQCEDRCHRPGTTQSVNIYTIITRDTVDERVHDIISRKEGIANYIVDGKLDLISNPGLFDMLLGNKK